MRGMTIPAHLITAYGNFWEREEAFGNRIERGKKQLLGSRGVRRPGVRLCDFRKAAGVYILWNDYRAVYVGLARGGEGLYQRLSMHHAERSEWNRFSWYSVDPVIDSTYDGWSEIEYRDEQGATPSVDVLVRELEALLIMVLGTHSLKAQRAMKFLSGGEWLQVKDFSYATGGVATKVDQTPLDKKILNAWKDG